MTIKEAILKSLEELVQPANNNAIFRHITEKGYYTFHKAKTPEATISALLGDFIRNNDSRVKRIKNPNKNSRGYQYYLSQNEDKINFEAYERDETDTYEPVRLQHHYHERDLHKLLSSYLKNRNIYAKTILHEESKNSRDDHQKWIHPDMIGVEFIKLTSKVNKAFMKVLNKADTFKLTSYEIKREIKSDSELKKSYFQAVSNSSWANYGYLVALEINDNLKEEIERLHQSFGIGIIELKSNPYESKILYPAKLRELDFKTIDKLCRVNEKYEKFIELIERILVIDERNYPSIENELHDFCDSYFVNDSEIEAYCKEKGIPFDSDLS